MREYINNLIRIDGRNIPYPLFTSSQYFGFHDDIVDVENFIENNPEVNELVTQVLALKQSCFLLRHTTHSCQSLSDGLYDLKNRLIKELKEKHGYVFDDEWVEKLKDLEVKNVST